MSAAPHAREADTGGPVLHVALELPPRGTPHVGRADPVDSRKPTTARFPTHPWFAQQASHSKWTQA